MESKPFKGLMDLGKGLKYDSMNSRAKRKGNSVKRGKMRKINNKEKSKKLL
jgi:hypothetical protein